MHINLLDEEFDHKWEELRNEAPDADEITRRIAVCNMDWDRLRAVDLLVCFNSFKPADGIINSVKVCFLIIYEIQTLYFMFFNI